MIQKNWEGKPVDPALLETEIHRLNVAVDQFAVAMKARLAEKAGEGWTGWDDPEAAKEIWTTMLANGAATPLAKGHEADIANYAMMLWQINEKG